MNKGNCGEGTAKFLRWVKVGGSVLCIQLLNKQIDEIS